MIWLQPQQTFAFPTFYWIATVFFNKSNSFVIVFKDEVSEFIVIIFVALVIFRVHVIILGKQEKQKENGHIWMTT